MKMPEIIRICAAGLVCLMAAPFIITSCGEAAADPIQNTNGTVTDAVITEEPAEIEYMLPERDFGGRTFTILTGFDIENMIHVDEQDGDIVNDEVYLTEKEVEELYNVNIETIASSEDSCTIVMGTIYPSVMSGDNTFNTAYANSVYLADAMISGIYKNLFNISSIDMTKPWWPEYTVEALRVGDQLYLGTSTVSYSDFGRSHVLFANKKLSEEFGKDIPYSLVEDGTWTLDKLVSLTSDVYLDINGNSERDPEDTYGWIGSYWANHWALSSGLTVIDKTSDDDVLRINVNTDRMSALVDKVYTWFFENTGSYIDYSPVPIFAEGHGVFAEGSILDAVNTLRSSEVEYGILPYPKYEESQKSYYSYTQGFLFVLPNIVSDEDFDGSILEALAYFRHRDLIPAFYEITTKGKLAESPDDEKMLDIVYNTLTATFDRTFDAYHGMQIVLNILIPNKDRDFASWYASALPQAESKLVDLADFYKDNL